MLGHEVARNTSFNGEIYILRNIAGGAGHFQSVQFAYHHAFVFADGAVPIRLKLALTFKRARSLLGSCATTGTFKGLIRTSRHPATT